MKSKSGFTLVEIMIVVLVISILASIVAVGYNSQLKLARDDNARQGLISIHTGLERYFEKNGVYPLTCNYGSFAECSSVGSEYLGQGATAPSLISASTTSEQLNQIMPDVHKELSHPVGRTNTPINQVVSNRISSNSYYVFSMDSYAHSAHIGLTNIAVNFEKPNSSSLICRYSLVETHKSQGPRPYNYVLGFYSQAESSWQFYQPDQNPALNRIQWNSSGVAECQPSSLTNLHKTS